MTSQPNSKNQPSDQPKPEGTRQPVTIMEALMLDASKATSVDGPVGSTPSVGSTEAGTTTVQTAPTNAATYSSLAEQLAPSFGGQRLSEAELDFVTLLDMHWHSYGEIPTAERAHELYEITVRKFNTHLAKPQVREALKERGLNFKGLDLMGNEKHAWRAHSLSPKQLLAANIMLDMVDNRSDKKKLQDLGITTTTWSSWLRDPVFSAYLRKKADAMLEGHHHDAIVALLDRVRNGDPKALTLYFEYTGKYRSGNANPDLDLQGLLTRILEIIIDVVSDPNERMLISERLQGLGQAHALSTAMTSEVQPLPSVTPTRELSKEFAESLPEGFGVNI